MVSTMGLTETLQKLHRGIYPRNIAVFGAARHNQHRWLKSHLPFHEKHGKVFHVNINEEEWPGAEELGVQNYRSILDIEEPIDYVTISVPRKIVPRLVEDCIKKGVALVHIFTAGFEESGEEEGIQLDEEISRMARESGLLIMGPNCMGLFNPAIGIRQSEGEYYYENGGFAYISQSGSMASGMAMEANAYDVKMSKCISMGNGMILDAPDYIDYLVQDPDTKVIGLYLEGLRNPGRFFKSLQEATKVKPVLVWKVGLTEDAARATEAHTGTSFIREDLWHSLLMRCGAIAIESQEEMIDTVKALELVKPFYGFNTGLYANTGGHSTDMANVFSKNGFKIVPLTESSYDELRSFYNMIGGNYVNPIQQAPPDHHERILKILSKDNNLDLVVMESQLNRLSTEPEFLDDRIRMFKEAQADSPKPIVAIVPNQYPKLDPATEESINKRFSQEGIPAFPSFVSAARALKKAAEYYTLKRYLDD